MEKFKFLEHTADIKFQAFGRSVEEVFENSALAMAKVMCDEKISNSKKVSIKVEGGDLEGLLYNFLEEILFLTDSKGFLVSEVCNLQINNLKLSAMFLGGDIKNYNINTDVKAVTYNSMFVKQVGNKWVAQVVLDV